jgi:hypothetical protein
MIYMVLDPLAPWAPVGRTAYPPPRVGPVVHVCCKHPFQMFHQRFQTYIASVLIWMLYMFHTYVVGVCSKYLSCFSLMLQ